MRFLMLVPLAALAACGGETAPTAKAPERAQTFQAGQWESNLEVTNFRRTDEGSPRLNMPNGTRATGSACVAAADTGRPPLALFVGSDFTGCRWADNFYMRNGRFNVSLQCTRDGLNGKVTGTVDGPYGADQPT